MRTVRRILALQGALYVVAGLWPLLHMASFEWVTGPKTDDWLVQTVGLLLAVIGAVLLSNARRTPRADILALALGAATSLAAIEIVHVANATISAIYLLDACIELAFAAVLVLALHHTRRDSAEAPPKATAGPVSLHAKEPARSPANRGPRRRRQPPARRTDAR